ncbi:28S ribosomal protein S31, mitochondrial [Dunckerocampus dactyliophorus]|uniref:28S ribosomal protein S31, mitochondrial n=1 Tax=Dunckerocampus dactyliophorus TaxID=161453 RepID=UPI0024074A03|nr:28S ribosomal protein S31, mitochondrial [Dunckerocampus dactyliophorus]
MYRLIPRTLCVAQKPKAKLSGSRILPANSDTATASIFRLSTVCTAKYLSTNSTRLCENKNSVGNSNNEDPTETQTVCKQQTTEPSDINQQDEQNNRGNIKKMDVINGKDGAAKGKEFDTTKSGKESLLDLLGAMRVDVTSKRLKHVKIKPSVSTPNTRPNAMERTVNMFQEASVEASSKSHTLDPELVSAASAAASTLPNRIQAESELLSQLRQHEALTEANKKGDVNDLGVILADMKVSVGSNPNRQNARPANQIRFDDDGQGYKPDRGITAELDSVRMKRNLFTGKRLNIFSLIPDDDRVTATIARPTIWDVDFAHQLSSSANQMPQNAFEEMIQWTKEGRLWQYPINNEACFEEDASVPFYEHVFLEKHLEEGFPSQGPVRHFMELVVIGLSKNPYLTVQQKKEHISWFRDYFNQKKDVLTEAEVYLT